MKLFEELKLDKVIYVLPNLEKGLPNVYTYIHQNEVYKLEEDLFGSTEFLPGTKLLARRVGNTVKIEMTRPTSPKTWYEAGEFKGIKICHGQNVLVTAPPSKGKSYTVESLMDIISKDRTVKNHRVLFGERRDDTLGNNSINIDSSLSLTTQINQLYVVLTKALHDAHEGNKVILGIDSLTRLVESLTNTHSDTHMVSGGISVDARTKVEKIFRMAGRYESGYLTIIGTCLYSNNSMTWKNIYSGMSSIANAEFFPASTTGRTNNSRRKPDILLRSKKIFGVHFEY